MLQSINFCDTLQQSAIPCSATIYKYLRHFAICLLREKDKLSSHIDDLLTYVSTEIHGILIILFAPLGAFHWSFFGIIATTYTVPRIEKIRGIK